MCSKLHKNCTLRPPHHKCDLRTAPTIAQQIEPDPAHTMLNTGRSCEKRGTRPASSRNAVWKARDQDGRRPRTAAFRSRSVTSLRTSAGVATHEDKDAELHKKPREFGTIRASMSLHLHCCSSSTEYGHHGGQTSAVETHENDAEAAASRVVPLSLASQGCPVCHMVGYGGGPPRQFHLVIFSRVIMGQHFYLV
jgi:hypothetical protein